MSSCSTVERTNVFNRIFFFIVLLTINIIYRLIIRYIMIFVAIRFLFIRIIVSDDDDDYGVIIFGAEFDG